MDYQLRVGTEELKMVTDRIIKTTEEINGVIKNLESINNNISNSWNDETSKTFTANFGAYIRDLYSLTQFYNDMTSKINKVADEYDNTDMDYARRVDIYKPLYGVRKYKN